MLFLSLGILQGVSVPLAGTFNFCHNSDTISVCVVHTVARLLAPEAMAILRSYCIAVTPYRPHPRRGGLNLFEKPAGVTVPQFNTVYHIKPGLIGYKL